MRDIPAGSELTIDYVMTDGDPVKRMECSCGAPECCKVITGDDWRLPALRQHYAGYFSGADTVARDAACAWEALMKAEA